MALLFPNSPALNQLFSAGDVLYKYDGEKWVAVIDPPVLGTAAEYDVATSGASVPLLNGANTWSATQTFTSGVVTGSVGTIDATTLSLRTNNADRVTVDSLGRMFIGNTVALPQPVYLGIQRNSNLQLNGTTIERSGISIGHWQNTNSIGPYLSFARSKSGTIGQYGVNAIASGLPLGAISFSGDDGTAFAQGALIEAAVDGTVAVGSMPSRLTFSTTPSGSVQPTERLRIDTKGNIGVSCAPFSTMAEGSGIVFGSSVSSSIQGLGTDMHISAGGVYTGSTWVYSNALTVPTNYYQSQGVHVFRAAIPGAVGQPLTWVERLRIDASGHVLPGATNTYDLGSSSLRWRNIYTQDLHLSNGIGDYTVVEGEENLYLVNHKTGKSFKFALIEVPADEVPPMSARSE